MVSPRHFLFPFRAVKYAVFLPGSKGGGAMRILFLLALIGPAMGVQPAAAQPYGTDLILSSVGLAPGPPMLLYRLDYRGRITTISTGSSNAIYAIATDKDNANILVGHGNGRIAVLDPGTGAVVRVLWAGPPLTRIGDFCVDLTGDVVLIGSASGTPGVFRIRADGGRMDTLHARGLQMPYWILLDQMTGQFYLSEFGIAQGRLFRMSRDGSQLWKLYEAPMVNCLDAVQDHTDGSLILNLSPGPALMRISSSGIPTLISTNVAPGRGIAFDRDAGQGQLVVASTSLYRLQRGGKTVTTLPVAPGWLTTSMCFEHDRNLVTERAASPNLWRFHLCFPGEGGRSYTLGLSLTGFTPGIPVGHRVIPLIPDDLLALTLSGSLGAAFQGNIGFLDTGARATATLDLRTFPGGLTGLKVWAAAVTIDAAAPSGLATISKPHIILLD